MAGYGGGSLLEAPYVRHLPLYPRSRQIQLPPRFPGTWSLLPLAAARPADSKYTRTAVSSHRLSQVLNALRLPDGARLQARELEASQDLSLSLQRVLRIW
jgi:hypothetical protein